MAPMRPEGLCQTIPRSRWCWCLGLLRGQGGRRAWPQARGPLNRAALLVPQGKPAMPGWACTQLGMEDGGGVGAGSPEQWLDCSHQGTDLPGAGPSHQKERHINRKPQAGENCVQMGKIMSFHLIQLPALPQALAEPPATQSPWGRFGAFCKHKLASRTEFSAPSVSSSAAWACGHGRA